jgi:uncharacterized protein (DUF58 family)
MTADRAPIRERRTFPLIPRRRPIGLPFGDIPSRRRGHGSDVIGHRPYEPGDPVATIDWFATARLSAATGGDEFVVRARAADEAPRVVLVVDRRPAMSLYPEPLPWLAKHEVLKEAAAAIVASAAVARADVASLDFGDGGPWWLPPGRVHRHSLAAERAAEAPFDAPEDTLDRSFELLGEHCGDLPPASFLFVLSDFLAPPRPETWLDALGHGWDVVPVVIQDPVWEQSFPPVGGVAVPVVDARGGRVSLVRLSRREAARRRDAHRERHARLLAELASFGLPAVVLGTADPVEVDRAFIAWAEDRARSRWAR